MNKNKGKAPPRYDGAFREGAVKLVTEQGRQSNDVAKELGICPTTLRNWLKSAGVNAVATNRENRDVKRARELESQVRELKRQLAEKEEVIDVLKKSVGIISRT